MAKRVCLLTGATGVLGSTFCRMFSERYRIVAIYHERIPDIPPELALFHDPSTNWRSTKLDEIRIYCIKADLRKTVDLRHIIEVTAALYGSIDLLVNAAGRWQPASLLDGASLDERWMDEFRLNLLSPIALASMSAHHLWRQNPEENRLQNRNVINISCLSSMRFEWQIGKSIHDITKAALNTGTMHLARELEEYNVRANAVAPESFSDLAAVERASDAIARIDSSRITGHVFALEQLPSLTVSRPRVLVEPAGRRRSGGRAPGTN